MFNFKTIISVLSLASLMALARAQFFDDDSFNDDDMVIMSDKCSQDEFESWIDDIEGCEKAVSAAFLQNHRSWLPWDLSGLIDPETLSGVNLNSWLAMLHMVVEQGNYGGDVKEFEGTIKEQRCRLMTEKIACFESRAERCLDNDADISAFRMVLIEEWFRYMADTGAGEGATALYPQLKKHLGEHVGVEQFQIHVEQRLQQELGELLMDCPALSVVKQQVLESMMDAEGPCEPEELHARDTAARACMAEIGTRFDPMAEFVDQIDDPTAKRQYYVSVKCQERQAALACQADYKECLSEEMLDWVREQEQMYFAEMEADAERKYPGFGFSYDQDCPGFEAFLAGDNDMWDGIVEFDDDGDWDDDDDDDEWDDENEEDDDDDDDDDYIFDAEFLV